MPKYENLIGQKFNKLTVIKKLPSENKKTMWLCKCECGTLTKCRADALKSNRKKSCGCLNTEMRSKLGKSHIQDITGQKFGKLTAIQRQNTRQNKSLGYDWLCECECGNSVIVPITFLKNGNNISCGCQKKSLGEQYITQLLIKENIQFFTQKSFDNLLSYKNKKLKFDFYLPTMNILIEFDGPQHYKMTNYTSNDQIQNDKIKNEYCLKNKITLYRIPYNELKNIPKYKLKDLLKSEYKVDKINFYNI